MELPFLTAQKEKTVSLGGHTLKLHLLTAAEFLSLRREAAALPQDDEAEYALRADAILLAAVLFDGEKQVFPDGDSVLTSLSVEEIRFLVDTFSSWNRCVNPSVYDGQETVDSLKNA